MAGKSLNASMVKLALGFIACIVILAPSIMATALGPSFPSNLSLSNCESFITEVATCMVNVIKLQTGDHPSCCKAISHLNECSPEVFKHIPADDLASVKKTCDLKNFLNIFNSLLKALKMSKRGKEVNFDL